MKKYIVIMAAVFGIAIAYQTYQMKVKAQDPIIIVGPQLCEECPDAQCVFPEIPGIAPIERYDDFIIRD